MAAKFNSSPLSNQLKRQIYIDTECTRKKLQRVGDFALNFVDEIIFIFFKGVAVFNVKRT